MKLKSSPDFWIAFTLFWVALLPVVLTAADIGFTYDEPIYGGASLKVSEWIKEGLGDLSHGDLLTPFKAPTIERYWGAKDMQPPTAKYLTALSLMGLTPVVGYIAAVRFASAFLFSVSVVLLFLWGLQAYSRTAGLFAAMALMLMPCVWGHAHLTAMDTPVAAMILAMTFCVWRLAKEPTWGRTLLTGLVCGLALGTKMNALVVYAVLLPWSFVQGRRVFSRVAVGLLVIGPLVFFLGWPWLWLEPLPHLGQYLKFQLKHYPIGVSYFGKIYVVPPWHYPFVMTAITTPLMTLILSAVGGLAIFRQKSEQRLTGSLVLGCFAVQLIAFALPGVPKYNGTRLFLSVFPFMAMLAGMGFDEIMRQATPIWGLKDKSAAPALRLQRQLAVLAAAVCLVPGLRSMLILHPFELSYYNQLIGGLRGAVARGLEPTYWGDAYMQTLGYFNSKTSPGSVISISPPGVVSYFRMYQRSGALREDLQLSGGDENLPGADYAVFHCRQSEMSPLIRRLFKEGEPVYTVECEGVPLAVVYGRLEIQRLVIDAGVRKTPMGSRP